jgi:hypothetical protein
LYKITATTEPAVVGNDAAQGNSDSIECRIIVSSEIKTKWSVGQ